MAVRWGLSPGAYKKFSFIFDQPLPAIVESNSPVSDASYIRDVIRYANENNLKGSDWYGNVKVTAMADGTISIIPKNLGCMTYPKVNVFEFLKVVNSEDFTDGTRYHVLDGFLAAKQVCENLQLNVIHLGNDIVEVRR